MDRIASTDRDYKTGDLSLFPKAIDSTNELYIVNNNATTKLAQSVNYNSNYFVVEDTSKFPEKGLFSIGTEIVYYDKKTKNSFKNLIRGFVGSRQQQWTIGTKISLSVLAEPRNAVKDALINTEINLGLKDNPTPNSLNGLLKSLENKFLSPKAIFQASSRFGSAPFYVTFQNFSSGDVLRYYWEFGDGATSVLRSPTHIYRANGKYDVKLSIITKLGASGFTNKSSYILVEDRFLPAYFYNTPDNGTTQTIFNFVDQSQGEIIGRYWQFGDGETFEDLNPFSHTITHQYENKGQYSPSLLLIFKDNSRKLVKSKSIINIE